ncbi:hypothetical protein N658DRAFT_483930 [Parathielavia hyrcaniae]|uniref:Uncharacterized protein n=1 Tax=Parathielavia hyrcaniae TaxID=113614 RepID=A0AAN6Q5B2_9PEZI|nr:hypothetical protein N658DRAFT_483930 [Parathielavia hyrcaniae]
MRRPQYNHALQLADSNRLAYPAARLAYNMERTAWWTSEKRIFENGGMSKPNLETGTSRQCMILEAPAEYPPRPCAHDLASRSIHNWTSFPSILGRGSDGAVCRRDLLLQDNIKRWKPKSSRETYLWPSTLYHARRVSRRATDPKTRTLCVWGRADEGHPGSLDACAPQESRPFCLSRSSCASDLRHVAPCAAAIMVHGEVLQSGAISRDRPCPNPPEQLHHSNCLPVWANSFGRDKEPSHIDRAAAAMSASPAFWYPPARVPQQ